MNKTLIERIVDNKNKNYKDLNIKSIIVFDNGKRSKHYFCKPDFCEIRSLTKVLTALAIGVAIDKGILSLETEVYPILKNLVKIKDENIEKIKKWQVKHLLTYTCGFEKFILSRKDIDLNNIEEQDFLSYVLNSNLVCEAGERYLYNNAETFLLSVVFQELTNQNLGKFLLNNVLRKINASELMWELYYKYFPGATGVKILHKDLFNIGMLILNKGKWGKEQIVSEKFIDEMCSVQLETPYEVKQDRVLAKNAVGYVFNISRDGYVFKGGANGQYLIINFEKQQVISILSDEKEQTKVLEILRGII